MLVICEDCAKKYNIDETLIKGDKARFSCQECGHIIVVKKPDKTVQQNTGEGESEKSPEEPGKTMTDEEAMALLAEMDSPSESSSASSSDRQTTSSTYTPAARGKGIPISIYILMTLVTGFVVVSATFGYLYLRYIPEIINDQIDLRTQAIVQSFSGVIKKPLLLRNYLQVNKEARRISQLPGVAYAAVVNKKGIVIAGFFSDLDRFDKNFAARVRKIGFPADILEANKLTAGTEEGHVQMKIGGQPVLDKAVSIAETGGEVHVGIYLSEVNNAIRNALLSPLTLSLIGGVLFVGFLIFLLLTRSIAKPMRELTDVANRISLGEMELAINPHGPREMRELATAFERMRYSIKVALARLAR